MYNSIKSNKMFRNKCNQRDERVVHENYETLLEDIKEHQNEKQDSPCSLARRRVTKMKIAAAFTPTAQTRGRSKPSPHAPQPRPWPALRCEWGAMEEERKKTAL